MNKVTVSIVKKVGQIPYFKVEHQFYLKHFSFKEDAPEGDIYNKEANRQAAMELAAKIEQSGIDTEEIIYQTPENQ